MRKKSLLVSANAPFLGPRIYIENGSWQVDPIGEDIRVDINVNGAECYILDGFNICGPAVIQAQLNNGKNVSLAIRQIENA